MKHISRDDISHHYTDHKPMENVTLPQTRALQRLQQLIYEHHFKAKYIVCLDDTMFKGEWAACYASVATSLR